MRSEVLYISSAGALQVLPGGGAHAPLAVIVDLLEEHLERAALPQARGGDLRQLAARRLAAQFPDTPYRLALPLRNGSGEDSHVFVGVPADRLDASLQPLVDAGRAVRGVWTIALLLSWWLRLVGIRLPHLLLVIPTPAGIRHVYLRAGLAVVSRLIPHDALGHGSSSVDEELARTVQYLYNARLIDRETVLPASLLGSAEATPPTLANVRWLTLPAARGLPDLGGRGIAALAELLQQRPPRAQLAPAPVRMHWLGRRFTTAVASAAAIVSGALLFASLSATVQAGLARETASALRAEIAAMIRAEASADTPEPSGVTPRFAAHVWRIHQTRIDSAPQLRPALFAAASAFDAAPEFVLDEFVWRAADRRPAAIGAGEEAKDFPCAPASGDETATLYLGGKVSHEVGLRRALVARERFERALDAVKGIRVQTKRVPVTPEGPIDSAAAERGFAYCVWLREPQ